MTDLVALSKSIGDFHSWNHAEKIKLFAWFLHTNRGLARVTGKDIKGCYDALHLEVPSSISPFLNDWTKKKPKTATKDGSGYSLVGSVRSAYDNKYGRRPTAVIVDKFLADLPTKVPNLEERDFLKETITCYKAGAFRASIVMAWNLAYDHLIRYIHRKKLAEFNTQYPITYAKKHSKASMKAVAVVDDFAELKESEVIQIAKSANIISNDVYKILNEKLGTRNTYAHPSDVVLVPHTAEEMILNLVNNVVLKYT